MIIRKTKNIGFSRYPIEHSLSPTMQDSAIANEKIDYIYVAMPVFHEEFGTLVEHQLCTDIYRSSSLTQKALEKALVGKN